MNYYNYEIPAGQESLDKGMAFIEESLDSCKIKKKPKAKALLLSEEAYVALLKTAVPGEKMKLSVRKTFGTTRVQMKVKATEAIDLKSGRIAAVTDLSDTPDAENAIRGMILRSNLHVFKYSFRNGMSRATIVAGQPTQKTLLRVLNSMIFAIVLGLLMRFFCPEDFCNGVNTYVFETVKSLFLNALSMVLAPLIFFSIAACVSSFTDLTELGQLAGKVLGFYTMTTVIAVIVAIVIYSLISPGEFGELLYLATGAENLAPADINLLDTIKNIIPDNFFGAMVKSDMLQIIFLSILFGAAVPVLGANSGKVADFLAAGNDVFLKVAEFITSCLPVAIIAFMGSMVLTIDLNSLGAIVLIFGTVILGLIAMFAIYLILVAVFTKTLPVNFLKMVFPAWLNAFALSSSNASMTYTMDVCDKNLKISKKLYSFSIPLGATINMDANVVAFTMIALFLAKEFGIEISAADMTSLVITVIVLSFGCPGIPGAGIIIMTVLLAQLGLPAEALTVYIGMQSLLEPFVTGNNVMGDVVGTYCIGKHSGMMQK